MSKWRLGDIEIEPIIEFQAPMAAPLEFFHEATPDAVAPHRHWLEPVALDPSSGRMIMACQSYLVRTRHHTILIDTCNGCHKSVRWVPEGWRRDDQTWLDNLMATGVGPGDIDYVFCTHFHSDHSGWNTRLEDGRWTPTFANAKYIFARAECAQAEAESPDIFRENVLPVMEANQAVLVDMDYALDDQVWLEPTPGHTAGHVAVNLASKGADGGKDADGGRRVPPGSLPMS